MNNLYKITPKLFANIWGGNKLREYGKASEADRIGESWELSFVHGSEATIENGKTLVSAFPKEYWGKRAQKFEFFPTLTKFIDAKEKLSVQVHPSDEYALKNEGQYGKSEMWYVVSADDGAGLYMGLAKNSSANDVARAAADGTIENMLSFIEVKGGDVFFIPAGTIHAIGGGVLIFEIQQNSTLTYRLYDYMRKDQDGNLRELHLDRAVKVLSPTVYKKETERKKTENGLGEIIGECEYFKVSEYNSNSGNITITSGEESFLSITAVKGSGTISDGSETIDVCAGDSFFIPAVFAKFEISGDLTFITVEV